MLEFSAVALKHLQRDRETVSTKFCLNEKFYCISLSPIAGKKEPNIAAGFAIGNPRIRKLITRRFA